MSDRIRCHCQRCTIRSLMGPAIVITLGVLFLLQQTHSGNMSLGQTWPVILLVAGAVSLAAALAPMTGHVDSTVPPARPVGNSNSAPGSVSGSGSVTPQNPVGRTPGQGQ